jgi:LysW-gamma-L-lysine carboxypeptidase
MVELYSPTGQEGEIAQLLAEEMRSLGLRATIDEVGNVIGESENSGPSFLLCGHMDTVPGKLPVKLFGNRLYGRGAVDAKAALAAMVCAAGNLVARSFPGRILVAGVVDEEGRSLGVKTLVKSGVKPDYAIFGEPSGVENITIAYKGSVKARFTCRTKTGHSSAPWLFKNAIEEAYDLWQELKKIHLDKERPDSKFHSLTSTLTEIHGGGAASIVPSLAELHVDFRVPPEISTQQLMDEVSKAIDAFCSTHEGTRVEVEVEDSCEGYEADQDSVLVRGLSWAIRHVRGSNVTLLRKTGTSDMNILGLKFNIPVVAYGVGDSKLDHTDEEYVDLNEYLDSVRILENGLEKTLELHNRSKARN